MEFTDPVKTRRLIALNNRTWRLLEIACRTNGGTITEYIRRLIAAGLSRELGAYISETGDTFHGGIVDGGEMLRRAGYPPYVVDEINTLLSHPGREWPDRKEME